MRGLDGKVAVIVGGAPNNIGAATAERLSSEGSRVVIADLRLDAAEAVADDIVSQGGEAVAVQVDIADEDSVVAMLRTAADAFGGIDNLFNVAADLSPGTMGVDTANDILTVPLDVWRRTLDVDLTGYLLTCRHVMPYIRARGGGAIVNTMSVSAFLAEPVRVAYGVAKSGIEALTRHIARVGGQHGLRCNAVSPGTILTEALLRNTRPEVLEQQLHSLPSTRNGLPEDIAAAVAFLFSDDGEWINGQTLKIDGGRSLGEWMQHRIVARPWQTL
jgi:NAD(P)-dependent dehydrogenase (short-subunit alcohol dehydrogenase family)